MANIQLYSLATPNGQKVGVALEEMGLPYDAHLVDIMKGDPFKQEFIKINPNSKIPAIIDPDGPGRKPISIFESAAILIYLGQKSGKFYPSDPRQQAEVLQWLFFQMSGVGPMFGQFGHFFKWAVDKCDHPYPLQRYTDESKRILGVLDRQLAENEYLAAGQYTIADMATVTWVNGMSAFYKADDKLEIPKFKHIVEWRDKILARPKTKRGLEVCAK